jgi:hypothetical protein
MVYIGTPIFFQEPKISLKLIDAQTRKVAVTLEDELFTIQIFFLSSKERYSSISGISIWSSASSNSRFSFLVGVLVWPLLGHS